MNYEKLYKEALERARKINEGRVIDDKDASDSLPEYIFPELKESKDERIRNALIAFHKATIEIDGIKGYDIIEWLEKQKKKEGEG